jgi:hypothetical protein
MRYRLVQYSLSATTSDIVKRFYSGVNKCPKINAYLPQRRTTMNGTMTPYEHDLYTHLIPIYGERAAKAYIRISRMRDPSDPLYYPEISIRSPKFIALMWALKEFFGD